MRPTVLGVLTTYPDGTSCRGPRWPQWRSFVELTRRGSRDGVLVYVFSPAGLDWNARRVTGFRCTTTPSGSLRWSVGRFPFPDVVYNRIPTRIAEQRPRVWATLRRLRAHLGDNVVNPHYLNKALVDRVLGRHASLARHLPDTAPLRGAASLRQFLLTHRRVYLKSSAGSLGNGIMELTGAPRRGWRLRYNAGPGPTRIARYDNWTDAWATIAGFSRGRPFLMQQAIHLARADGRPFDLRLLVQKRPDGVWQFTGGAARVAGPGQITTHVPRGGRRMAMQRALTKAFGDKGAAVVTDEVETLSCRAAAALEQSLGRNFVELSLDIGVDGRGNSWIFELNSKPLRFDEQEIQARRIANLITYAQAVGGRRPRPGVVAQKSPLETSEAEVAAAATETASASEAENAAPEEDANET